jgi:hypothetical protein
MMNNNSMPSIFPTLEASLVVKDMDSLRLNLQALVDKPVLNALCFAARNGLVEAVPLLWTIESSWAANMLL